MNVMKGFFKKSILLREEYRKKTKTIDNVYFIITWIGLIIFSGILVHEIVGLISWIYVYAFELKKAYLILFSTKLLNIAVSFLIVTWLTWIIIFQKVMILRGDKDYKEFNLMGKGLEND